MSYMSLLEKKVRYSTAFSLLNNIRHKLENRPNSQFNDIDIEAINEALDLIEGDINYKINKTVLFSLQNMGNLNTASALELSEALESASKKLNPLPAITNYTHLLRRFTKNEILNEKENQQLLKYINFSMDIINTKKDMDTESNDVSNEL